jgi:probable addiction module antidote protein
MDDDNVDSEHDHFLTTPEGFAEYLSEVFKSQDSSQVTEATAGAVARNGLSEIARAAQLTRVNLYTDYVQGGEPSLKNFMAALDALGVQLTAVPKT